VTEKLSAMLAKIAADNSLPSLSLTAEQANENPLRAIHGLENISAEIKAALVNYTKYDQLLYHEAQEMFDKM